MPLDSTFPTINFNSLSSQFTEPDAIEPHPRRRSAQSPPHQPLPFARSLMATNNGAALPISAEPQHRGRTITAVDDRPQRSVTEQIADLTIAAPLPALALSDLVTKLPQWSYELESGLYLFRFEHQLDVCKVMGKGPWHFNGAILVTHELCDGLTSDHVPLTHIPFQVQVHKLLFGYFSESVGEEALGNFVGRFPNYNEKNAIEYPDAYMRIRVMLDARAPFQKERQEQLPFLWDDSIKVVSRQEIRVRATNPWLRVRDKTTQGKSMGASVKGCGRGMTYPPVIPTNIRKLAVCIEACTASLER
ncbi:hypothetical protein LINGRAHAP2_LOCUS10724 [Linum grandiflorum]